MSQEFHQQPPEHMPVPPSLLPEVLQRLGLSGDRPAPGNPLDLVANLKHPQWYVRANAVRQLGMLGTQAPLEFMLAVLDDPHVSVRANAIRALGQLPAEHIPLERLQQALQDSEWQVRESAIHAIEQSGKPMPIAALQTAAFHDPDERVREAAQRVIQQHYPEVLTRSTRSTLLKLSPASTVFTHLITYIKQRSTNNNNHHMQYREGSSMQDTDFSTIPMSRAGGTPPPRPPRRSTGPLWRTVGVSLAMLVVTINIVAWLLITRSLQPHTQTGAGTIAQDTPTSVPTPTPTPVPPGKTLFTYTPPPSMPADDMMSVGWSSDGKYIAVSGFDITLLDAKNGKKVASFGTENASIWVTWSPDGQRLITSSQDAKIWDVKTQHVLVTYTPTMKSAYVSSSSGNPLLNLSGGNMIYDSAWSPDGKQVASAVNGYAYGYNVQVWDAATGNHLHTLQLNPNPTANDYVSEVAWSPDGKYLATASPHNGVLIWNTSTWQTVHTIQGNGGIAWAPKGNLIATAMNDGKVVVWDASTGQMQYSFQGQTSSQGITTLAWSPDGRYIAVGAHDVGIWDTSTRKLFYTYTGHGNTSTDLTIRSLAWSPDSISIASLGTGMNIIAPHVGNAIGAVKVWIAG